MKKFLLLSAMSFMVISSSLDVRASSLDDVINQQEQQAIVEVAPSNAQTASPTESNIPVGYDSDFVKGLRDANKNLEPMTQVTKVNSALGKVASFLVQVISYAAVTFLSVRVALDLLYIALPFTRSILSNGHVGVASNPGNPGMAGGFNGGGFNGGSFSGGPFSGGMAGSRFGSMGPSMVGGAMQTNQANAVSSRMQLISNEAMDAVASASSVGADGRQRSVISIYFKSIIPILVGVPLILTLTITGVLSDLGFLIGDALASFIANLGNMI